MPEEVKKYECLEIIGTKKQRKDAEESQYLPLGRSPQIDQQPSVTKPKWRPRPPPAPQAKGGETRRES